MLTFLVNILCLPLYIGCVDYGEFVHSLFTEDAYLSLLYSGKITGSEPFRYKVTPNPLYTNWMYVASANVHRANLSLKIEGKWQRLSLQLEVLRDGKITMLIKAPAVRDEYGFYIHALTDWRNLKINGINILPRSETVSSKKILTKQFSVKKGDSFHIEAEFRRHHFSIQDFAWLKSEMIWYIITGNLLFFFLTYRLLSYIQGGVSEEVMLSF